MTNEEYLVRSYFVVGIVCLALSALVYALLKRHFDAIVSSRSGGRLSALLRRLFLVGLVFPSLMGFLSVSYKECGYPYRDIVADRSYLIHKNQLQLSSSMRYIAVALVVWGLLVVAILGRGRNRGDPDG